ncbi:hypothetical protein HDU91_001638, partial [Kappamyces sp. JEL0680]
MNDNTAGTNPSTDEGIEKSSDENALPKMQSDFEAQFLYAAKNGHLERAERLLLDGAYDPSKDENSIIQWACENGLEEVVQVLLKDARVDVQCKDDICIQMVCEMGHTKVLEILLEDGRADPTAQDSIALWLACQNGHSTIVQMLVDDGRVNLNAKHEEVTALEVAVLHEYYELAQILLLASKTETVVTRAMSTSGRRSIDQGRGSIDSPSSVGTPVGKSRELVQSPHTKAATIGESIEEIQEEEYAGGSSKDVPPPHVKDKLGLEIGGDHGSSAKDSLSD